MSCTHNSKRTCNTCNSRKQRAKDPMKYAFYTTRANVYRRKGRHFWELTFEEFSQYATETDYIIGKGITKHGYTIDVKDPTMGYFIGNIRTIPNGVNSSKKRKFLHYEWSEHDGRMVAFVTSAEQNIIDGPF